MRAAAHRAAKVIRGLDDSGLTREPTAVAARALALVRDDRGSVVIDADLSALGPLVTILGGMEKGEALAGADYRDRPDFWRVT